MDEVILTLDAREVTGKQVKKLRAEGQVPAVIHDHGKDSVIVMGPYVEVLKAYQRAGKHHPISLKAGGKNYTALIKSADFDPKKHLLRHVVFNAVKANEKVTAEIPVRMRLDEDNESTPAERNSLIVLHNTEAVEVEAIAKKLPDFLEFDGEKLVEVGDTATVADLIIPEGVEVKAEPTQTLSTVFEPSALAAANDAAGGTDEDEAAEDKATEGAEVAEGEVDEQAKASGESATDKSEKSDDTTEKSAE
jgi:large subunit ribosomal protein L25